MMLRLGYKASVVNGLALLACAAAAAVSCLGQTAPTQYLISTFAGSVSTGDGGPATSADLIELTSVATDTNGSFYISEWHRVRKISGDGTIVTLIGDASPGFNGDNIPSRSARLANPAGFCIDQVGNIFIADALNHRVRKVTPEGIVTTLAGTGEAGYSGDNGAATSARLNRPSAVTVDTAGTVYVSDTGNQRIRAIGPDGLIRTIAGTGAAGFGGDGGPGASAQLNNPRGIAVDESGNVFVADAGNARIRRIDSQGSISTIAGTGEPGFSGDRGPATLAQLGRTTNTGNHPGYGLVIDKAGQLYLADTENRRVRRITPSGGIDTIAGSGRYSFDGDGGAARSASFLRPTNVAVDPEGNVYVSDSEALRLRKILTSGVIITVAGRGTSGGDGGPSTLAWMFRPHRIAVDSQGNVYITEHLGHRVRKVAPGGITTTVAGTGLPGFSGEGGPATQAQLQFPNDLAVDGAGNLYIADSSRIRRITPAGIISTFAGGGDQVGENVPALQSRIATVTGLRFDKQGNLCYADGGENRVRRISATGLITTIAGGGTGGDGGPARSAQLAIPQGIDFDSRGNLYIADQDTGRIRRVTPEGVISTVATARTPHSVRVDSRDNVIVSDTDGDQIFSLSPAGMKTVIAGTGKRGFGGDGGPAVNADLYFPTGLEIDASGNIFVADLVNQRVRKLVPIIGGVVNLLVSSDSLGFFHKIGTEPPSSQGVIVSSSTGTLAFTATSSTAWLTVDRISGTTPATVNISVNPSVLAAGRYTGTVTFTAPSAGNPPQKVSVTLTITPEDAASLLTQPASLLFNYQINNPRPAPQSLFVSSSGGTMGFITSASVDSPPGVRWLSVDLARGSTPGVLNVSVNPAGLDPGIFDGVVTIRSATGPESQAVPVRLVVENSTPPTLVTDADGLTYAFSQVAEPETRQLTITNPSKNLLGFEAAAVTNDGNTWLKISQPKGAVDADNPVALLVSASPEGLQSGTYTGKVLVSSQAVGSQLEVPVQMTVSRNASRLLLSQTGLSFTVVSGSGVNDLPQSFGVLNTGVGQMSWQAAATTLSGGPNWLQVSPNAGVSDSSSSNIAQISVRVNASGLSPGEYHGQVQVSAVGADNTPATVSVILTVLPPGANAGPGVYPTGVIFTAVAGGGNPPEQSVLVINRSGKRTYFGSSAFTISGGPWLGYSPVNYTFDGAQIGFTTLTVRPNIAGLSPGIYEGRITMGFPGGINRVLNVLLVVASSPGRSAAGDLRAATAECTPTKLLPLLTSLEERFTVARGEPTTTELLVVDDCGNPAPAGAVGAIFSNRDRPLNLSPLKNGRWIATWLPANPSDSGVTIQVDAADPKRALDDGRVPITGFIRANTSAPLLRTSASVVNAASNAPHRPLAPGALVSIFGTQLAATSEEVTYAPWPTTIGGVSVTLGDRTLPLRSVNPGRIDAVIPFGISPDASYSLVIKRGSSASFPEPVNIAVAQPGIFSADGTGKGQGRIYRLSEGQTVLATPDNPALPGNRIIIHCTGLGTVDPPVEAGAPPPESPTAKVTQPVSLTIGGVPVQVDSAELAPGNPGLYYVYAVVPGGITPGTQIPVVLSVAGFSSHPVTMAVRSVQ